ncbi:MAG: NADP-dependent malic enzyme [Rhodospirillaceae bacterium]|nr:NADP-dependent malic enzyme [Rhodospirillaceae bacterium]
MTKKLSDAAAKLREDAIEYHRFPTAGKISVNTTVPLANQRDLSLAYSPGVAYISSLIEEQPDEVANVTARGNLVAVISNGTAVLGLGNIGALASKPVMEGKGGLFKKFAGIDVFDIEINETDPDKLVDIIVALEPTFGGINLEDIKAPECFEVEEKVKARIDIPVMHDDQHGTAIITGAAVMNAMEITGRNIEDVTMVCNGAGAAALACLDLLLTLGLKKKNILMVDSKGVVHVEREGLGNQYKARYAAKTEARSLADAMVGRDIFLGVSVADTVTQDMIKSMAPNPIIMALANPDPEIRPELVKEVSPNSIIATGRSDYPNQVNNVLCFPFMFRGALDVGATTINDEMKAACTHALAALAKAEADETVVQAYGTEMKFGPDYVIPKPFDPRLLAQLAPAVAKAAMDSGVATRPIKDFDAYRQRLSEFTFQSGHAMRPLFDRARLNPKRIVYAEGESSRVLRAVQNAVDEGIVKPIMIGRRNVVALRLEQLGLRLRMDDDFELCDPQQDDRYRDYWEYYHTIMRREGVSVNEARRLVRTNNTVIAALMVQRGEADGMLCGAQSRYTDHLEHVFNIIELRENVERSAAMSMLIMEKGTFFICDPYVNPGPSAEQIAQITVLAAETVRRFGIEPKAAMLSHSNFGSSSSPRASKMREAVELVRELDPSFEVEGEMHADVALREELREPLVGSSNLTGSANLLIMPSLDAANISYNLLRVLSGGVSVGPMLLGLRKTAHILQDSVTTRGILNMTAIAVVDAQSDDNPELPFGE